MFHPNKTGHFIIDSIAITIITHRFTFFCIYYSRNIIENIIIDKYVMFFSGKINIEPKNKITIEIPAIQL